MKISSKECVCRKDWANGIVYFSLKSIDILFNALLFINVDKWKILFYNFKKRDHLFPKEIR